MGALLLGLPALALAWPFRRRARFVLFYALMPAVIFTNTVSRDAIMPWLRDMQVTSLLNSSLPLKLNDHTTLISGSLSQRRYVYQFELDASAQKETADQIKQRMKPDLCKHWLPQFKDRSAISAEYRYMAPWGDLAYMVTVADCI